MRQIEKKKTRPVKTQIEVPCPKWLQKTILKNLEKSSTSRFWPDRAKKATEILNALSVKGEASKAAVNIKPSISVPSTQNKCLPEYVPTLGSWIPNFVTSFVFKPLSHFKDFITTLFNRRKFGSAGLSGV